MQSAGIGERSVFVRPLQRQDWAPVQPEQHKVADGKVAQIAVGRHALANPAGLRPRTAVRESRCKSAASRPRKVIHVSRERRYRHGQTEGGLVIQGDGGGRYVGEELSERQTLRKATALTARLDNRGRR